MVYRKGERTNRQREAEHPYAVDILIGGEGLGQNLNLIVEALRTCPAGGDQWGHTTRLEDGTPRYWCRVGVKAAADADRLAGMFAHLGARRVR
jgi:hypothetical protein